MTFTKTLMARCTQALFGTIVTAGLISPALAADFTMKLATPTINDLQHEWMQRYKEELEERSEGRIEVQLYPASQLGPIQSMLEGLQLGTVEGVIAPAELYAGVDPRYQVPAIPHLFSSMEDARAKLDNEEVREMLLSIGEDKGLQGITVLVYGPQRLNTRTPVATLSDLSGQRIRVLASQTEIGTIEALGASSVPMPLNEVGAALQQGVIDGYSTVLDVFNALGTHSVAPNVYSTELWYLISYGSVSKAWFDSLPEDLQTLVLDTAKDLEQPMFERQLERSEAAVTAWEEAGGSITEMTEEDSATANAAAEKVAADFVEANPELKDLYEALKSAN